MYNQLAAKTANGFIKRKIINEEDREIYEYSFEVFYSDIMYSVIAVVTALVFQCVFETVAFYIGFTSLRHFAGGFHASSYKKCHLLFWFNQLLMIGCHYLLPITYIKPVTYGMVAVSIVLVFVLAPVAHDNKPLSEKERKRFFWLSRAVIVLTAIAVVALGNINVGFEYVYIYVIGVFSVSASLLAEKVKKMLRKEDIQ